MAKFLKSFFHPNEKKRSLKGNEVLEEERGEVPQLDGRRKLSISRSGRMKQANKKRHSLSLDLYGEKLQVTEKEKQKEYHVHGKGFQTTVTDAEPKAKRIDNARGQSADVTGRKQSYDVTSTEEEIDSAFEIIDKVPISN